MKVDYVRVLLAITFLFTSLICGVILSIPIKTQSTTYVYPDHFLGQTLQEAIWNETVSDGDIIVVRQGTYYVHLNVNKSITLEGFDRGTTILDGSWNGTVIGANASNVNIFEFTIQHGNSSGVYLYSTANCNVSRNIIKNNIRGIKLTNSSYCALRDNDIKYNTYNFGVSGDTLEHFIHDIDVSNKVSGRPIYYGVNKSDEPVPTGAGYIALVNSTKITVKGAALTNNYPGILIAYTNDSTIENMDIRYNYDGVLLWHSHNNTIRSSIISDNYYDILMRNSTNNVVTGNIISGGYGDTIGINLFYCSYNNFTNNKITSCLCGIELMSSSNNTFYHNNIMYNTYQLIPGGHLNVWDNGREGNYWSDYQGNDTDGDGIGNTPYLVSDYCPLIEAWSSVRSLNITSFLESLNIACPKEYTIATCSDHVVASIKYYMNDSYITFNLTAGSSGYCSVTIPRDRLDCPFRLFFNGTLVEWADHDVSVVCNATHSSIYFNYTADRYMVKIDGDRKGDMIGDLNGDGLVDMRDIGIVCFNFLKSMPYVIPPQE